MGLVSPLKLAGFSFACLLIICGLGASLWGLHLYLLDRHVARLRKNRRGFSSLEASAHTGAGSAESIVSDLWSQGINVTIAYDWIITALAYEIQSEVFVSPDDDWAWMTENRYRAMAQWVIDAQATVRKVFGKKESEAFDMHVITAVREIERGADPDGAIREMVNTRGMAADALEWLMDCIDEKRWPTSGPYAVKP
jgi:hypothetical protein